MSREEIALQILCAQIQSGKPIGSVVVKQAFALAVTFEEMARELRAAPQKFPKLSYDDNGL